ncbi:unnamed protein product [Bursaphelenchus xylophilus]|uniref:(pine wood nematode) hypothetical protein n=1 Tax=Bursaphelenchus xylophilus TaxID=6326 RepID=A0A1I7RMX1_BURXY|nr:unnamed protein product [Bursaphelenchus xylophilus]CAG9125374.1 unnamed protein product [Bursaphelenchus xylophilus]
MHSGCFGSGRISAREGQKLRFGARIVKAIGMIKKVSIDAQERVWLTEATDAEGDADTEETEESLSSSETPTSDQVVNEEQIKKTQRRIMGVFVIYVGRLCGIHPVKAPYFCSTTECKKLKFRDRLNLWDILICLINTFVCLNHIYIRIFSSNSKGLWASKDRAKWLQTLVSSSAPLLVIMATSITSPGMDRLLYLMSNKKQDIIDSNNKQRIRRWTSIMFILNISFGLVMLVHFSQVLTLDFIHYNFHRTNVLDNDFLFLDGEVKDVITNFLLEVDRRYYNLMAFMVMKVPQVMIMMIAIENGLMFAEAQRVIGRKKLTKDRLTKFFEEFRRVERIQAQSEHTFNRTVFVILSAKLADMTLRWYILMRYFTSPYRPNAEPNMAKLVIGETQTERWNDEFWEYLEFSLLLIGWLMRFVWTMMFVLSLIYCNEKSREALPLILNKLAPDDAKNVKDQLIQKFGDTSWGLTMGKFIHMDRSALLTMVSIVFTVVAVWLQISHNSGDRV